LLKGGEVGLSFFTERKGRIRMDYNLREMDSEIKAIEESTKRLKVLGQGIETVERNAEAILAFTYLLKRNISDILD